MDDRADVGSILHPGVPSREMNVRVNGQDREVPDGCTIAKLVESLGYGARQVVVEHNGEAVERGRFAEIPIVEGDTVEVVRAVAGG